MKNATNCKYSGGFIYNEPPRQRNFKKLLHFMLFFLVFFVGAGAIGYINYINQVNVQQIDRTETAINAARRIQLAKLAKLNQAMKYENIQKKASLLGLNSVSTQIEQLALPEAHFDETQLAFLMKRRTEKVFEPKRFASNVVTKRNVQ
ncbi:MAG: hypothetical protein OEM52_04470 [bacterium]|nr:hypothetical protein [bacterium]